MGCGMSSSLSAADPESDVVLRDGAIVRVRPSRDDDAAMALRFFEALSAASLYHRFLGVPRLDMTRVTDCIAADQDSRVVLIGERGGECVGVAGYYVDPFRSDRAEVGFAIADDMHGRGLGRRLLERLADVARLRGVREFEAYVRGENRRMMDVLLQSGFAETRELEQGTWRMSLSLERTARLEARRTASFARFDTEERFGTPMPTILIVDDEMLIRWALAESLTAAGFQVIEAANAADALERFVRAAGSISVAVLDMRLPDSSDFGLLLRIHAIDPSCKVILITADGTPGILDAALDAGAFGALAKPFDMHQIAGLVRQATPACARPA
jgi:CheY-like chemotaxis protein/RimJ/RimL family protein N-acetyltransferase